MEKLLFTIYDSAAGGYLEPFWCPSPEFAIREFRTAVNTEGHQFGNYPQDFTLFAIGSFNIQSGIVDSHEPVSLGQALSFVERIAIIPEEGGQIGA